MKRKLLSVIIALLSCVIFITSCDLLAELGIGEHVHEYGEDWQSDESSHWKRCVKEGCQAETDKAAHSWGNPVVTEPEIGKDGKRVYECTVCGKEKTDVIPAPEHVHTAGTEWINDDELHWNICDDKDCDARINTSAHVWDNGTVITPATSGKDGTIRYICVVCKATKNDTLPALPDKMSESEWISHFDIDNARIDCLLNIGGLGSSTICTLIDGELASVTSDGETYYSTSEEELSQIDFSGAYDSFNHLGDNVYYAANVTLSNEEMDLELTDVTVIFLEGKIASVYYIMNIFGMDSELTFILSEWGEVTVELPALNSEAYADLLSPEKFDNYTLEIDIFDDNYDNYGSRYQFDADSYTSVEYKGSGEVIYGTLEQAGIALNPILEVLYALSAEDFIYASDYASYYCQSEKLCQYDLSAIELTISQNGYLSMVYAEFANGLIAYYTFSDYDETEFGESEELTELDEESYASILDSENFSVYTLSYIAYHPDATVSAYLYYFDGERYVLTVNDDTYYTTEGTLENAGVMLNNAIAILDRLSYDDYVYDEEYCEFVLSEPSKVKDTVEYFGLCISDGHISYVDILYTDGTEEFYSFYDYGIHNF